MTARSDGDDDFAKRRLAAMMAARHAILALRLDRDVPDLATAHGVEVAAGCVVDDLGRMADVIKDFFLDDVPALVDSRERAIRWAVTLEGQLAAIEKLCAEWEADEREHLNTFGQHLPCSLAIPAEQLRAALTGSTE